MQWVSSRIWTRVAVFISYDDNNYTTGTSLLYLVIIRNTFIGIIDFKNRYIDQYIHSPLRKKAFILYNKYLFFSIITSLSIWWWGSSNAESAFHKATALLEPHHQIDKEVIMLKNKYFCAITARSTLAWSGSNW